MGNNDLSVNAMDELIREAWQAFAVFSPGEVAEVRVFFAPGRVNLIGEHTDYNGGYVLPAALELGTWVWTRRRTDGLFRFASTSYPKLISVRSDELVFQAEDDYANYPKGVLWTLALQGVHLAGGADFLFAGNLPTGAGLSSSASIEVAMGVAVRALANEPSSLRDIALMAQTAENQFVGVQCGIMDQFAVAMGQVNHALSLDCATLNYASVPIELGEYQVVLTNSNKRRGLADSKYNERRAECEIALRQIQVQRPFVHQLADVSPEQWPQVADLIDGGVYRKRARHVVMENHRAKTAPDLLRAGDLTQFGDMMNESHVSLRDDYEVTGMELDTLAQTAWDIKGCLGSRMTGAGFGGCTVSLVHHTRISEFKQRITAVYQQKTGLTPSFYVTGIGGGAREVTQEVQGR